jgi:RNA polymerase sigma factor FliA
MSAHQADYVQCQYDRLQAAGVEAERGWLMDYMHLVRRTVRTLSSHAGGIMEREDMEQIGLIGLLEALRRYGEPDAGFAGFACLRIRGAILDEMRRQDWRPRRARQAAHRLRAAERMLRRQLGRDPERAEVCSMLEISGEDYDRAQLDDCAEEFASFDALLSKGMDVEGMQQGPEARAINQAMLARALRALDEREQRVIQLYYEFDLNLEEIAQVLDLTAARICQINKRALSRMRATLEQG